mgnify:FL=1|tara:strand:+ start:245 stop:409 length:165 start_codon:yes stop_codon:yes gene_type:complete
MNDKPDKIEVGSETGIEQDLPFDSNIKSEFDWLASIKRTLKNIVDIVKILTKWR